MSSIPVELPEHLVSFVSRGAEQAGYSTAGEYIAALVAAASEKQGETEQALMAGISSGDAKPWTDAEWKAIKERVIAKSVK
ncbi:ribbon-helix-helix domain-containing protein [Rosistilla oblonga]|uniref:ribbon-helix-helix domain-containing protein n=1 Tax=Rosistilla oblonga TaxID=2527990 RepID=UPI003A96BA69